MQKIVQDEDETRDSFRICKVLMVLLRKSMHKKFPVEMFRVILLVNYLALYLVTI
jgi:hypothetical protein